MIDVTGLDELEDTNVANIKPQVGCFVFHDNHGAIVKLSGSARHFDNEIARTGLKVLTGRHEAPSETLHLSDFSLLNSRSTS